MKHAKASLILENGVTIKGVSFGAEQSVAGEVVFNTAMTGYPESLTDPSYRGQILVLTYPLIGNYGVPDDYEEQGMSKFFESDKIHISGLIISDYSLQYSHWRARSSLSYWLKSHNVPGLFGIDTRRLTKMLREKGSMLGKIIFDDHDIDWYDPNQDNLVKHVSIPVKKEYGNGRYRICLIDCGVKNNIIRCLLARDTTVIRVPWDHDISCEKYDGLFISNGPGDPAVCETTIHQVNLALSDEKPIFGICLGNQIMALAAGASSYKLKYGHRSHNQPVIHADGKTAFITAQNHGFTIDNSTLPPNWEPLFINLNDGTNEGMKHKTKPFFSAQFHPEASGGPADTIFLFDEFLDLVKKTRKTA